MNSMKNKKDSPIKTVSVKKIYKNPWLTLEEHKVVNQDNKPGLYGILDYGDGVSVLAINHNDKAFLVEEYKYGIGEYSFQLPSGSVDKNETPLQSAKKELLEEAGLKAKSWKFLGITHPFPTNITTTVYLYLAKGVEQVRKPEEGVNLYKLPISKIKRMIKENKITHSGSLVCLLKYFSSRG